MNDMPIPHLPVDARIDRQLRMRIDIEQSSGDVIEQAILIGMVIAVLQQRLLFFSRARMPQSLAHANPAMEHGPLRHFARDFIEVETEKMTSGEPGGTCSGW